MGEEENSGRNLHPNLNLPTTNTLTTEEYVGNQIKEWIIGGTENTYDNAVCYIESYLNRHLLCLETTWFERQYVKTILQLWLEKSLSKSFEFLDDEKNDISDKVMSTILSQLNSINSFEDMCFKLNGTASLLQNWCDEECRFLKLILEQEDLFKTTSRFNVFLGCYFEQFKTSCIDRVFSRCLGDIVKDKIHGEKHTKFIMYLNEFLSNVNDVKTLHDKLEEEEFLENYVVDDDKTGQDLAKKLVEILDCISESEHGKTAEVPEKWLQTFLSNVNALSEDEWTPRLQLLTKETCKKFLLPKTNMGLEEEDGKRIICVRGVTIFVSKLIEKMKRMKDENLDVEEIKIAGLQSVHIDCDLDNNNWHGINIGIVTDKLIVDNKICWDVSGQNAFADQSIGKYPQPGESGGNVRVVCNKIINGQEWTIVSNGGDGSAGYKWTKKEFEKAFPSMSTGDREENMKTVLTTLERILPQEKRREGKHIGPDHKRNFFIEGNADDGTHITAIFYGEKNKEETLVLIRRGHIGQGGYGGDITIECFKTHNGESSTLGMPFAGRDTRQMLLRTVRMGVYEATCPNGNIGKVTSDVAFIHKVSNSKTNCSGTFYGFETDENILIRFNAEKTPKGDKNLNIQYEAKKYAKLSRTIYSEKELLVIQVDAVKKNAIIRQSLVHHFDQIDKWKQLTKSIQKMLSNPTENCSNSIGEILNEMENKVHQFYQLVTQRQQHHLEKTEQEKYARPVLDKSHSSQKPKIVGRRPVWNDNKDDDQLKKNEKKNFSVYCLDELQTEDGILHCLFGQMNSNGKFVCKDPNKFRKRIAKYVRRKHRVEKTYNAVLMFVLRVNDDKNFPVAIMKRRTFIDSIKEKYKELEGMDNQVLRWLKHNDDYDKVFLDSNDIDKWNKAWFNKDSKSIKKQLMNDQRDWENDEDLKQEYTKYIESQTGTLGLAELEILAVNLELKVNVYINHDSSSFRFMETLSVRQNQGNLKKIRDDHKASRKYCVLYEGNGRWKKLSPNYNLHLFCKEFTLENDGQNCNQTCNTQLYSWIKENTKNDEKQCQRLEASIAKLKQDKTPDKLFQLLLDRLKNFNVMDVEQVKQLTSAMCSLVKWVDYYNTRNVSPLFYLHIIEKYNPGEWESEFLLLEMEERLEKPWKDEEGRNSWRNLVREYFKNNDRALSLFIKITLERKEGNDILFSLNLNKLLRMLTVLEKENLDDDFSKLSLINLFYKQRSKLQEIEIDKWLSSAENTVDQLKEEVRMKKSEYVNLLLEMEYKNELLQSLTCDTASGIEQTLLLRQNSTSTSREVDSIISEMKGKDPENKHKEMLEKTNILVNDSKLEQIEFEKGVESIAKKLIKEDVKYKRCKRFLKEEQLAANIMKIKNQSQKIISSKTEEITISKLFLTILKRANDYYESQHICYKIGKLINDGVDLNDNSSLAHFLCVFDFVVQRTMGFSLRDTQRVAIMTLLVNGLIGKKNMSTSEGKTFAQVSTGEGKSIIVAGVAIGFALVIKTEKKGKNRLRKLSEVLSRRRKTRKNSRVDVITSNDILAFRDSNLPVAKGGLKELYEFFNVSVANNCSTSVDERRRAYNMDVVYGQLANFQRDYLLDTYYNRKIRGNRQRDFVIIDEVDCMLLDRGNNMLYLSHDIPGMEMLESLYVFIWGKMQATTPEMKETREKIKSAVLFDLYGQIAEQDLKRIHAPLALDELAPERIAIWEHLIEQKVFDRQGRLLINDVNEITEEKIHYTSINAALKEKQLNSKIIFYVRTVVERQRRIRIPSHLLSFVDRHLDTWLDNARRALELKQDEDYVIDHDRSDLSPDFNPQVIIIDPDTGTDQSSSQWDGALHQFLQLKEGCKLTLQSLKAVFISNATYIKKYDVLAGVSGTLGSQSEQTFLKKKYRCDLLIVPTAFLTRFSLRAPKLFKSRDIWRNAITQETQTTIKENRSIIIFCKSIKEVNEVYRHLKSVLPVPTNHNKKRIHRYTRDYETFEFENEQLDVGHAVITTNLAGRGTDIKISDELKKNGGLHICLTYFAENERVEEQAMGRAARKGEPGSGILILLESQTDHQGEESAKNEECEVEKIFVMKEERAWRERQRILRLEKDFVNNEMLEMLIEHYTNNLSVSKVGEILGKEKLKEVENQRDSYSVKLLDDMVLFELIHNNTLDKWALWLDERDYSFKCFDLRHKQKKFNIALHAFNKDILKWMTPARRIAIINKHLAMTNSEQIKRNQQINPIDTLNELMDSTDHFFYPAAFYYRAFIDLRNKQLGKNKTKKETEKFIRTLRKTEMILNEHIDMQIFFGLTHLSDSKTKADQTPSFCAVDGYMEQKENNVKILQCFLGSIQWMLGKHCSISDLRNAGSETPKAPNKFSKIVDKIENKKLKDGELKNRKIRLNKVDQCFRKLIEFKCIIYELNDSNTIPVHSVVTNDKDVTNNVDGASNLEREKRESTSKNILKGIAKFVSKNNTRDTNNPTQVKQNTTDEGNIVKIEEPKISSDDIRSQIILQIADDYGVIEPLETRLNSVFGKALNEGEIEKELEKMNLIPRTRKAFWNELAKIDVAVLKPLTEWEKTECFIVSEEQVKESKLDKEKAITLEFGLKSFDETNNFLYVLYNPTYDSQQQLKDEGKFMFSKEYLQRSLLNGYKEKKQNFESNKIAKLDLTKLEDVDLKSFGRLTKADFDHIHIKEKSEQEAIWEKLKEQKIIDIDGYFEKKKGEESYDLIKDFSYPDCPVYADAVSLLIRKKFVVEIVRQQWLKSKENADCLKAINLLRRKPYRDMLGDLMAAQVISGARVTEDREINLKEEVDKITKYDEERKCLLEFLTSRQSVYAEKPIVAEFFLANIEHYLRNNFSSELYVFRFVGFDHVIDIKDKEWTFKRICFASLFAPLIFVGGIASICGGGAAFYFGSTIKGLFGFKLPFTICKNLLFMGGFSDILYIVETILSRKDFKLADYGRQRIRSAIGKMKPVDAIEAVWKLSGNSNQSFKDLAITDEQSEHRWKPAHRQKEINQ